MAVFSVCYVIKAAVQQLPLVSFGDSLFVDGCTLFSTTDSRRGILAGGRITTAHCSDGVVTLAVIPALLRLSRGCFGRVDCDLPYRDAVALLRGLPPVRIQRVFSKFPVFTLEGESVNVTSASKVEQMAREHLKRLCAYVPNNVSLYAPFAFDDVTAWLLVSYPNVDAVLDSCVFILPDTLVAGTATLRVGYSNISPCDRDLIARPALNRLRGQLEKLQLSFGTVRVVDPVDLSGEITPHFVSAFQMV